MLNSKISIEGKQYRITGTIGKGATGVVYLAKDQQGFSYALKAINNYDDIFVKTMVDTEIKMQKQFQNSKYIIQYVGVEKNNKNLYIVLELGECSLRHWVEASSQIQQKQLLTMICNVCQGLTAIHNKNIIHRDIKPENIIKKGNNYKIADFGCSSNGEESQLMVGTALYWPPQILLNQSERISKKVDVWSLAVSIFETYFKIHPFCPEKNLSKISTMKKLKTQLLLNISQLAPNFNMKKFISHLNQNNFKQQSEYVQKKIMNTTPRLIQNICRMFQPNPDLRPTINEISSLFSTNISTLKVPMIPKTKKITFFESILPEDVQLFCNTKDMVYQANFYGLSKHYNEVILSLQLSISCLQNINYEGTVYIQFDKAEALKKYIKKSIIDIQKQIRSNLSQYYFYLQYDAEAKKYHKVKQLRRYILVCSVWFRIIRDSTNFCKMVSRIADLEIQYPLRIFEYMKLISQKNLDQIQNKIVSVYYV